MQVFKLYMKILSRYWGAIAMYVAIFMLLTLVNTRSYNNLDFRMVTIKTYIQDEDGSLMSRGIVEFLKKNSQLVELTNDSDEGIKDALFFRKVEYVLHIPKGFGENFLSGKTGDALGLKSTTVPDSASVPLLVTALDKYINVTHMYFEAGKTLETNGAEGTLLTAQETAVLLEASIEKAEKVSEVSTPVDIMEGKTAALPNYVYYFAYLAYPLIAIFIMIIPYGMITVNDLNIKRRNLCSPISLIQMNLQLFLGNLVLAMLVYTLFWLFGLAVYGSDMVSVTGILATMDALALTVLCLALAFLISSVFDDKGPIAAVSTALSLGVCFTSGVFVDQSLLSEGLKNAIVVNPVFWYVKSVRELGAVEVPDAKAMGTFWMAVGLQIVFAIAVFAVSLVITKQKRTTEGSGYKLR